MRAMVLEAPGRLVERELPEPRPGPGEVLIDVDVCGVCRTDLQIVSGDIPMRRRPVIPGHQVVGRARDSGERVGVAWLRRADGTCELCRRGLENLCADAEFTGWTADGGYAEAIVAPRDYTFRLPDGFADLEAAPLMCAGIIGYRSLRLSGVRPGGRLGLFGFGSSAHLAIQVARHWGCEVSVFTRSADERARAQALGAVWIGGYDDVPPTPLDATVTFAPVGSVVVAALRALAPGGTVAVNAIHLDTMPQFSYDLLWRERSIRSVANFTRADAREFLDLAGRIPVRAQVQELPLARANDALAGLAAGRIAGSAVLRVRPAGTT
jgi:alcohol dehydrogenase, propanol-preferring